MSILIAFMAFWFKVHHEIRYWTEVLEKKEDERENYGDEPESLTTGGHTGLRNYLLFSIQSPFGVQDNPESSTHVYL